MDASPTSRRVGRLVAPALIAAVVATAWPCPPAGAKPRVACADLALALTRCTDGRRIRLALEQEARERERKIAALKREVRTLQDRLASPWLDPEEQERLARELRARRVGIEELTTGAEEDLRAEGARRARPVVERLQRLAEELRVKGGYAVMVTDRADPRWADCADDLTRDLEAAADRPQSGTGTGAL